MRTLVLRLAVLLPEFIFCLILILGIGSNFLDRINPKIYFIF